MRVAHLGEFTDHIKENEINTNVKSGNLSTILSFNGHFGRVFVTLNCR